MKEKLIKHKKIIISMIAIILILLIVVIIFLIRKEKNKPLEEIIEFTGLTKEEIEKL